MSHQERLQRSVEVPSYNRISFSAVSLPSRHCLSLRLNKRLRLSIFEGSPDFHRRVFYYHAWVRIR